MSEDKINRIETALAHHEQQIEDLSEMIRRQWQEIDLLKRRLASTQAKVNELNTGMSENDPNEPQTITEIAAAEKPPHY